MNGRPSIEPVKAIPLSGFGQWRASKLSHATVARVSCVHIAAASHVWGTKPAAGSALNGPSPTRSHLAPSTVTSGKGGRKSNGSVIGVVVHLRWQVSAYAPSTAVGRRSGRIIEIETSILATVSMAPPEGWSD